MRWLGIILAVAGLWPVAGRAATNGPVCIIEVREDITHNTLFLIRRGLAEAAERGAVGIVLDLETNGGRVDQTEKIIRALEQARIPTVTFVNVKAFSAGAFIAAATDKIYMAPGSVIGAATPIMLVPGQGPTELSKAHEEKLSSAMRGLVRSTAQLKGHNPDVFEAMVDADRGLTIEDKLIVEKGKLLTLTNEEAAQSYGEPPVPLVSLGTVADLPALLATNGWAAAKTFTVVPTGFEVVGRWLTTISPLLMLIGFVAIYLELKTPGLGVPTVVAVIAFTLYFIGNFIAGLAGMEEVVIFAIGVGLLLVEIFVLPGFGIAGFVGIAAILIALVLGMTERFPDGATMPTLPQLKIPVLTVIWSFIASIGLMALIGRYFPRTSLFRKMELATAVAAAASTGEAATLLGCTGVAETILRPAGKGRFGERLVDVVTAGDLVEKGAAIKIVAVNGSRVEVERTT